MAVAFAIGSKERRTLSEQQVPLSKKVHEWLEKEGYPLEFRTASAFERSGFHVSQGHYVQDEKSDEAREIDVLADMMVRLGEYGVFRVYQVIECKWSKDKPWVVFTSPGSSMAESACIAQSIASRFGQAVTFCATGNPVLRSLELFKDRERGGFAGRRAFDDKHDQFYGTIQGIIANAVALVNSYDQQKLKTGEIPKFGAIAFPVIVVDGCLFEAYYQSEVDNVNIKEISQIRVFWRGSSAKQRFITPVDIVAASSLAEFATVRASEVAVLFREIRETILSIQEAFAQRKFEKLKIQPGSRGVTGLPSLLAELYLLEKAGEDVPQIQS